MCKLRELHIWLNRHNVLAFEVNLYAQNRNSNELHKFELLRFFKTRYPVSFCIDLKSGFQIKTFVAT